MATNAWDDLPEDEKNWWRSQKLETGSACAKCGRPADADPNDHAMDGKSCYHCGGCGAQVDSSGEWHSLD
jgi:DNA-directed RNA polymerase subunit RPC12/RpoP